MYYILVILSCFPFTYHHAIYSMCIRYFIFHFGSTILTLMELKALYQLIDTWNLTTHIIRGNITHKTKGTLKLKVTFWGLGNWKKYMLVSIIAILLQLIPLYLKIPRHKPSAAFRTSSVVDSSLRHNMLVCFSWICCKICTKYNLQDQIFKGWNLKKKMIGYDISLFDIRTCKLDTKLI